MNDQNLQQEIQQKVLTRVRSGAAHVHSKVYFAVRIAVAIFVSILVLALSALVLSFVAFSIHASGQQFLLGFGAEGIRTFFALFPWMPLLLDIALIFLLEWLLQGFRFGYRVSLLSLFLIVCVSSVALAALVNRTPLHGALLERADRGELPVLGETYESIRDSHGARGIFRGTVSSMQDNTIVIMHNDGDHDRDDGTRTVALPAGSFAKLHIGSRVYVFGTSTGEEVGAYGIEELSPDQ